MEIRLQVIEKQSQDTNQTYQQGDAKTLESIKMKDMIKELEAKYLLNTYADKKRKDKYFQIGDHVYLKVKAKNMHITRISLNLEIFYYKDFIHFELFCKSLNTYSIKSRKINSKNYSIKFGIINPMKYFLN